MEEDKEVIDLLRRAAKKLGFDDADTVPVEELLEFYRKWESDIKPCPCCGQDRPCPTKPGVWEYNENVTMKDGGHWFRVNVVLNEEERCLNMIHEGETEPAWWPQGGAAWRKIE